jgi:hypothetical protein
LLLLQAYAKDSKSLQLLKALITQQAQLAATPATGLTAEHIKQLQQVVQEAEVKSPEAFKLDADQVRGPRSQLQCFVLAFTSFVASPLHQSSNDMLLMGPRACQLTRAYTTLRRVRVWPACFVSCIT